STLSRRHFLAGALALPAWSQIGSPDPWRDAATILKRIVPPQFPKRDFNITRFGENTDAVNKAISACHDAGGGRVVIPAGEFTTGAVRLRSGVNLHLSEGAVLKFSTDPARYLPVVFTRWEGTELMNYSPFIYAFEER